jgi:hypothetical protein
VSYLNVDVWDWGWEYTTYFDPAIPITASLESAWSGDTIWGMLLVHGLAEDNWDYVSFAETLP